jgi:hypothetical protein
MMVFCRYFVFIAIHVDIGKPGFFRLEVDFHSQASLPFDNKRLGCEVMQVFTGNRVSCRNDHTCPLASAPAAAG